MSIFPPPRGKLPSGVKATSGGTFDPDAAYTFFTATDTSIQLRIEHPYSLVAVNDVTSASGRDGLKALLDAGKTVMLDSGIFNLAMSHARAHDVSHDTALNLAPDEIDGFDELWDNYADIVTTFAPYLWGIVEMDQGGAAHKPATRARIENELGIVPIPVYHPLLDGWDYYDDLARGYDRICFGNLVQASPQTRMRLVHTAYERARDYPYLWTHLLGVYPDQNVVSMPMRGSTDASSFLTGLRWPPSWTGKAMLRNQMHYPPPMWSHRGTQDDDYDPSKGEAVCSANATAAMSTVRTIRTDEQGYAA